MDATLPTDNLQTNDTLTLAEDKAPVSPPSTLFSALKKILNVPAVVIGSMMSSPIDPEKLENGEELHQPLTLDEDPARSVLSTSEMEENDTTEMKRKRRGKDNEEDEGETEAKLETRGKKKETNKINSDPAKAVILPEEYTQTVVSKNGSTDVPKMKRRYDAKLAAVNARTKEKATSLLFKMAIESDEPAMKHQQTMSTPSGSGGGRIPSDLRSSEPTASSEEDDIVDLEIEDDGGDPTFYELNREERRFLRHEAARAFARFTAANLRVQSDEGESERENHNLEKCRSALLRILLMLPRRDRTILWTNMGQPDIQALLGL